MPVGSRQEYRSSQELDPERSTSLEDEGAARGFYLGLFGIIFKWSLGFLFVILAISAQDADISTFILISVMFMVYVLGWITIRNAGIKEIATYETVGDVLAFGIFFGFVIRVVEGLVWMGTAWLSGVIIETGVFGIDHMSPFLQLANGPFAQELAANNPIMAGGTVLIAVGLIVAAVGEELFYRGSMIYGINFLTDKKGTSAGVATILMLFFQAGIFALLHALVYNQWPQIIALFAGGIVFGVLFLWKKDLSIPILAHVTLNLSSMTGIAQEYLMANPIYLILLIGAAMLLIYLMVRRKKRKPENKNDR